MAQSMIPNLAVARAATQVIPLPTTSPSMTYLPQTGFEILRRPGIDDATVTAVMKIYARGQNNEPSLAAMRRHSIW